MLYMYSKIGIAVRCAVLDNTTKQCKYLKFRFFQHIIRLIIITRVRHFRSSILAKYVIFMLPKNPEICFFRLQNLAKLPRGCGAFSHFYYFLAYYHVVVNGNLFHKVLPLNLFLRSLKMFMLVSGQYFSHSWASGPTPRWWWLAACCLGGEAVFVAPWR